MNNIIFAATGKYRDLEKAINNNFENQRPP